MINKEFYAQLCAAEPTIPIFSQDWWLDSVAGPDGWNVAIVEKDGVVQAAMPYAYERKGRRLMIRMPLLTQTLGPWIRESSAKYSKCLGREKDLLDQLIAQLPPFDYFLQHWHYSRTNWLPFYWKGFKQTTRYSYVLPDLTDLGAVFEEFDSAYRNKIRKAGKLVTARRGLAIDRFYEINMLTFSRQGKKNPYSLEFLKRHDAALAERDRRMIFYAEDSEGRIHSALYLTWDAVSAYVHMVGEDPELRKSGAGIFLIWEAMQYTANELNLSRFDFEGSMLENVERVRRDCGGIQTPYFSISKTPSRLLRFFQALKVLRGSHA